MRTIDKAEEEEKGYCGGINLRREGRGMASVDSLLRWSLRLHRVGLSAFASIDRNAAEGIGKAIKNVRFAGGDRQAGFSQPLDISRNALNTKPEKPGERGDLQSAFQRQP